MDTPVELSIHSCFRRLLTSMWLRPERALWEAHQLELVGRFLGSAFTQPSLEYGCTDGVLTFVMLGGVVDQRYDDYAEVNWNRDSYRRHSGLKSDYFDAVDAKGVDSVVASPAAQKFTHGVSWKQSHIEKAERFGIYENLTVVTLGEELHGLPQDHFETVFAPNLFWIGDEQGLAATLASLRSVLKPGGRLVTFFPGERQAEFSFQKYAGIAPADWLRDLDRGIHDNSTRFARSPSDWSPYFRKRGFKVVRSEGFIPAIVSQVYQVGFRPMFPVFMNMREKINAISPDELLDFKAHWIETIEHFMGPLCDRQWMTKMGPPDLWNAFELEAMG